MFAPLLHSHYRNFFATMGSADFSQFVVTRLIASVRPPRLRCTLFPLIYPPHLLVLPATFGLHLLLQTYPYFRALYVISVRRTKSLLTASFRFHLTMDTLAVRLYTSSLPRCVRDFHPLDRTHGAQTKERTRKFIQLYGFFS